MSLLIYSQHELMDSGFSQWFIIWAVIHFETQIIPCLVSERSFRLAHLPFSMSPSVFEHFLNSEHKCLQVHLVFPDQT